MLKNERSAIRKKLHYCYLSKKIALKAAAAEVRSVLLTIFFIGTLGLAAYFGKEDESEE